MASLSTIFSVTRSSTTSGSPSPAKKTARRVKGRNRNLREQRSDKPSVIQIERAIGAGSYRDSESGEKEGRNTVLDGILMGNANKFESPLEKKLRELSEAFVARTESRFRSNVSLLVACGVVKLPFSLPFLDDLIM
ncbi:PREDICTED: probable NAD(P)H dehydrogenase subunit CRR3, chloroplastic [Tarenaya hassleriana]|uniref:probable NAD(P)H dehydrogenase subunit CRR3, chloroplastic n=1 Tax=Tarenaya hassleriana TaxID=28532 RepID=UPI00053CA8D9|nr:PREDICTED: probable NAD(P)H dehydrogenase subunit CRR3, chloroplastic [Tarenaya hassleriana]